MKRESLHFSVLFHVSLLGLQLTGISWKRRSNEMEISCIFQASTQDVDPILMTICY